MVQSNPGHPGADYDRASGSRRAASEVMLWAWSARDAFTAQRSQWLFSRLDHWDASVRFDLLRSVGFIADSAAVSALHSLLRFETESPNCAAMAAYLLEVFSHASTAESSLVMLPSPPIVVMRQWCDILQDLKTGSLNLHSLPWREFEDLIAHVLEAHGWEITPMGYTKDGGVDIVAVRRLAPGIRFSMMVQCKRNSAKRKIGVDVVRQVWAVKSEKGFHQALLATTSAFTRGAKQTAAIWNLELREHQDILAWCSRLATSNEPE